MSSRTPHRVAPCGTISTSQDIPGHPRTSRDYSRSHVRQSPGHPWTTLIYIPCGTIPRTSQDIIGFSHMELHYVSYVPVLGDIPGHPGDGPTWGYSMCLLSRTWGRGCIMPSRENYHMLTVQNQSVHWTLIIYEGMAT